jgi:hypothetical protein
MEARDDKEHREKTRWKEWKYLVRRTKMMMIARKTGAGDRRRAPLLPLLRGFIIRVRNRREEKENYYLF